MAMAPVVGFLCRLGHRAFSYLYYFFEAARLMRAEEETGNKGAGKPRRVMRLLFDKLGLTLHRNKRFFAGKKSLEVLGILVHTPQERFVLSARNLTAIELAARRLLRSAARHCRYLRCKDVERFAALENFSGLTVVDCRLRLRELFVALSTGLEPSAALRLPAKRPTSKILLTTAVNEPAARATVPQLPGGYRWRSSEPQLIHVTMRDLQWWRRLSTNPHVGRAIWPMLDVCVFTDASLSGWRPEWQ